MAIIRITRESEYTNRLRNIKIFIDGVQSALIKNGETMDFDIKPGEHLLKAKIDWCGSNTMSFTIAANETKMFSLCSFAKQHPLASLAAIYYISFGAGKYLKLEEIF